MPTDLSEGLQTETFNNQQNRSDTGHPDEGPGDRSHHENYVKRRFRSGLPMVRWLNVQSQDFNDIFSFDKEPRRTAIPAPTQLNQQETPIQQVKQRSNVGKSMPSDLAEVAQKWIDHAKR